MPTTTPFNNLITFSRGSNATLTGPNGLIQWAPSNVLTNSEQFDNAAWAKTNATIFPNQGVGNGTFGPELVTNGAFTTDLSGWTLAGTPNPSWSAGGASMSGTSDLRQTLTTVAGAWYLLTFAVTGTFSSSFLNVGTTNGGNDLLNVFIPANGSILFRATTTTSFLRFLAASQTFTLDSISVKQVTFAAATAPDGTQTADNMVGSTGNNAKFVSQSSLPSTIGTFTVYAKAAGETVISLWLVGASVGASFTLTGDGSTSLLGATSSSITPVGGGWYRCAVYHNTATTTAHVYLRTGSSFIGDGTSGVLLWGAQLELGSTATTYNPTTVKNLLGFSEAFDNAAWTKTNSSIVTGAQANPINGLFNAQKLMEGTATSRKLVIGNIAVANINQTFSVYVKPAGRNFVAIGQSNGSGLWAVSLFNLSTGAFTASYQAGAMATPTVNQIAPVGNGWFRVSCLFNVSGAAGPSLPVIMLGNGGDPIFEGYTGDGNSGVYIYGAQLSDSASLDPYVPTPGAAPSSTAFYGPRFDFDPVTLLPRGLLVEEQRTNLVTYSDDFGNAAWGKARGSISTNTTTSPDGTTNADTLTATATGTYAAVFRGAVSYPGGAAYTLTVYAKANVGQHLILYINETGDVGRANFNLTTGAIGNISAGTTASITAVGNGWWRCVVTATPTVTASGIVIVGVVDSNTVTTVTSGQSLFLYGAQLEAGAFATSYIPTIASTVTRSADVATITGQNFAQWYRQDEGSFVVQATSAIVDTTTRSVATVLNSGTPANCMRVILTLQRQFNVSNSGATQADLDGGDPTSGAITKIGTAYAVNNFALSLNGGTVVTDTTGTVPTVNTLTFGANEFDASRLNGHIRSINFIPTRIADFQLQALTELPLVPTLDLDFLNNLYEA